MNVKKAVLSLNFVLTIAYNFHIFIDYVQFLFHFNVILTYL